MPEKFLPSGQHGKTKLHLMHCAREEKGSLPRPLKLKPEEKLQERLKLSILPAGWNSEIKLDCRGKKVLFLVD